MDIYLQDLGLERQMALLQWRASVLNSHAAGYQSAGNIIAFQMAAASRRVSPHLGWLGRLWAWGAGCPPEVAAEGLDAMRGQNYSMIYGMTGGSLGFWMPAIGLAASGAHEIAALMAGLGAIMSGVGLWVPGYWLRRICRPPVSSGEIELLQASTQDNLEQAYLRLAADAVRQRIAPEAAGRVRAALHAVGEAINHLPAVVIPRVSVDTLRAEAAEAQAEARAESDPVVSASHERRAEALDRSASAAQRSQVLMRRAAALCGEMVAQIESLRLGLAEFETASADVPSLVSLADAVRTVAEESVSMADARAELDALPSGVQSAETILELHTGG